MYQTFVTATCLCNYVQHYLKLKNIKLLNIGIFFIEKVKHDRHSFFIDDRERERRFFYKSGCPALNMLLLTVISIL